MNDTFIDKSEDECAIHLTEDRLPPGDREHQSGMTRFPGGT
jgi:hypothetical protein